jgi:hypothetical protein
MHPFGQKKKGSLCLKIYTSVRNKVDSHRQKWAEHLGRMTEVIIKTQFE